jgi:putative spermidine/putrescine transport system permease protein
LLQQTAPRLITMRRPMWGLALFLAISVVPILASLIYAGLYSVGLVGLLSRGFTLDHWITELGGAELWSSLGISVWVATAVVVVSTALGLIIALGSGAALDRGALGWSVHVPLAFPATVAALSVFMLFGATGWVPRLLLQLGVVGTLEDGWSLVHDRLAVGVIVAHAFAATALLTLSFRALQRSEQLEHLDRVAAALGATAWQRLSRISIPLLLKQGTPTLALVFILILGSYEIPKLLGRQSPQMLSVLVMRKYARFDLTQKPNAMVVALVYTVLVIVVLVWLTRQHRSRAGVQT